MAKTKEPELQIYEEQLISVGYEFYKFYSVFKDKLYENYARFQEEREEDEDDWDFDRQFPIYCFRAFTTSFLEYQEKNK